MAAGDDRFTGECEIRSALVRELRERIKEMTALHACAKLLFLTETTLEELLAGVAALLPPAFLHPECATGCVRFDGQTYATPGHAATPWVLVHGFVATDGRRGELEVAYHEARPDTGLALGPFLAEEVRLLDSMSDMLRGALDRRAAEEVAHHTKERLDLALSAAMMGVWDHDLATGTVTWSEHLARLVARDREMIGTLNAFSDYVHPDDQAYVIAQRDGIRDPDRIYTFEFRVRRGDGTWRPVAATGRMILDERGAPARVLGVIMDISARRALESGLQRSQKLETLGQVAGGVAHDFNNVLCSVIVNAEVLREDIEPGPLREQLDEIFDAAMRGAALARQLLSFSRNAEFHPTAVSLDPMITSMQPLLRRLAGRAIELRLSLATDGVEVWADPSQLEQVVMNLVVNARDAMPSGGTITVATERDPLADPGAVAIVVRDTGGGVPAEILERIFEPFFTTKPPGQGTGLGLAVVRAVARQWHGDVSVESTPGQGATFRVQLPVM